MRVCMRETHSEKERERESTPIKHFKCNYTNLVSRNNRLIGCHRKMNSRIRHQVGLELVEVDVEGPVEPDILGLERLQTYREE